MKSYATEKLGHLCEVAAGGTPSRAKPEYFGGDIPWVKISDLLQGTVTTTDEGISRQGLENSAAKVFPIGTVLISIFATIGRTAVLGIKAATNQAIAGVTPRNPDLLDSKYLRHYLDSIVPYLVSIARGVAQLNINLGILKGLEIPVPEISEQRRIAAILDQADALRAKRREALAQLDSLTQSIFIEMFGDPVENPNSWKSVQLSDVSDIVTGFAFKSEEYVEGDDSSVKLCRGANVLPGRLDWSDLASWPASKIEQVSAFKLQTGDIVMAMDRPWISEGFKVAQISKKDCPSLLVQRVARLRGKGEVSNDYIYHLLNHPAFTAHCRPTETTIPHISPREIRSFRFHLPPVPLQRNFVNRVSCLNHLKSSQDESLKELDALFSALQHRAFQGEL